MSAFFLISTAKVQQIVGIKKIEIIFLHFLLCVPKNKPVPSAFADETGLKDVIQSPTMDKDALNLQRVVSHSPLLDNHRHIA